ncbi:MAG: prepilin-type N-terminal cleavage/methylation domain-containing protein [Lentimonas sp.]|jgi:prepilin-type N-terminal cleavage/methylation domain-containing protein
MKDLSKIKRKRKGFSLIELSIVIIIIGILIAGVYSGAGLVRNTKILSARSITLSSQISSIPGMVVWVENSSLESFNASDISDGAAISNWFNREPSGFLVDNNLDQASGGVNYETDGINNLPTVSLNVAGNMKLSSFANSSLENSTIVIVFRPTAAVESTTLWILDSGASANPYAIGIQSDRINLHAGSDVFTNNATNPASISQGNPYILMAYFDGASSKVFLNNETEVGGLGATINPGSNILNGITLGSNRNGFSGISAEISELIIYDRPLKRSEREEVFKYLSKKYDINVISL